MSQTAVPTLGVGTQFLHRRYKVRVLRITPNGVVVQRLASKLVLTIPFSQLPEKYR
jgi:hypothetical protein